MVGGVLPGRPSVTSSQMNVTWSDDRHSTIRTATPHRKTLPAALCA